MFCVLFKLVQIKGTSIVSLIVCGYPNCDRTLSNTGINVLTETDLIISTIGYLEYSSIITNKYSPVGSGPQKSALGSFHGPEG